MTPEDALSTVELLLSPKFLNPVQQKVFKGAWQQKSYMEIAVEHGYDYSYIKDTGAQLWKSLSESFCQKVTKNNIRSALYARTKTLDAEAIESSSCSTASPTPTDPLTSGWKHRQARQRFCGRTREIAKISFWVMQENCKMISLLGIAGVGKTALAIKVVEQLSKEFEKVIWITLDFKPLLQELLSQILDHFPLKSEQKPITIASKMALTLQLLRHHRCLLILDGWDCLLQSGQQSCQYEPDYQNYDSFLEHLADAPHQSSVVITSREPVMKTGRNGKGESLPRVLKLKGLDLASATTLLEKAGLEDGAYGQSHSEIVQTLGGHPLGLKELAATVTNVLTDEPQNSLNYSASSYGEFRRILHEQISQLSKIERCIIYWLSIQQNPVSVVDCQSHLLPHIAMHKIFQAIERLEERSFISIEDSRLMIDEPAISDYVLDEFISSF